MLKVLHPLQEKIINRLVKKILDYYGENLVTLAIYGSFARGEPNVNSDLDILIILERKSGIPQEIRRFQENIESDVEKELQELYEKYGINMELSPLILSKEGARYFNPLYLDMLDSVVILFDRDDFFKKILEKLCSMRKDFKKIQVGDTYVWDFTRKNLIGEKIL